MNKSDPCKIIYNRSNYDTRKSWVSKIKDEKFKYVLIDGTLKKGYKYLYSAINNKGHFGISKIIFGQTGINNALIDMEGDYGMTEHAMAIEIKTLKEGEQIKQYIESKAFEQILKACSWSNFQIDWRLFTYFRHDFYI